MPYRDERGIAIGFGDAGEALEARYTAGEDAASGGSVIAAPHPLYGGSIDSPVGEESAFGFRQAGLATLSFNWRGVGASAGQPSGEPEHADEDYAAASGSQAAAASGAIDAFVFGRNEPALHHYHNTYRAELGEYLLPLLGDDEV